MTIPWTLRPHRSGTARKVAEALVGQLTSLTLTIFLKVNNWSKIYIYHSKMGVSGWPSSLNEYWKG